MKASGVAVLVQVEASRPRPSRLSGVLRAVDRHLHPRWRPDGKRLAFNSVHEGSRQVYVIDIVARP